MADTTLNTPSQLPVLQVYERTDVGQVRDHNEDSKYSDPGGRFFVVADGMGGHAAGEVASQLAVEEVKARLDEERSVLDTLGTDPKALTRPVMTEMLKRVGGLANKAVRQRALEDTTTKGMGTTLEVVCVTADGAWIGHVGDSRTYLVRANQVTQLTTDQTVAQQLSEEKRLKMAEVLEQWGGVLVEAIGAKETVNVDVVHCPLESGDQLLLCSDGLYEYFPRAGEIGEVLAMEGCKAGLERLVELAYDRGGKDNITGVLVDVIEASKKSQAASSSNSEEELEYGLTAENSVPLGVRTAALDEDERGGGEAQDYGIDEAIALMRKLPAEQVDLVVTVVKQTLQSAGVRTLPIIRSAEAKKRRIERRVTLLKKEIDGLKQEVVDYKAQISTLEDDRAETSLVKERLELAVKLDKE